MRRDFACEPLKEQTRRKDRDANSSPSQKIGKFEQIRMHQGFAASEHYPPDLKPFDRIHLRFELSQGELAMLVDLPDVAHHTTAVASAVRVNQQHGQLFDRVSHAVTFRPARRTPSPRYAAASSIIRGTFHRTNTSG